MRVIYIEDKDETEAIKTYLIENEAAQLAFREASMMLRRTSKQLWKAIRKIRPEVGDGAFNDGWQVQDKDGVIILRNPFVSEERESICLECESYCHPVEPEDRMCVELGMAMPQKGKVFKIFTCSEFKPFVKPNKNYIND